jgi:cation:H+ antiporter
MDVALALVGFLAGVALIVWGAETFAEHLGSASVRLGVSTFALALLLAGAEPEELATTVTASLRGAPAIALGDVIGANVTVCLVALGVGALVTPLPFGAQVRRYALLGLPLAIAMVLVAWDGQVGRLQGALLVGLYVAYVTVIWVKERRPPALGETGEIEVAAARQSRTPGTAGEGTTGEDTMGEDTAGAGRDVAWTVVGVAAMVGGAMLLVESVRSLTDVEETQTTLALTIVGFATGFELVVLAWSAARRGISEAVVAAVVGSFAYNATMSLGVAALAHPLRLGDTTVLHLPLALMLGAFVLVLALALPSGRLDRRRGLLLLACYPLFVAVVTLR